MKFRSTIIREAFSYIGIRGFVCGFIFGGIFGTMVYPIVGTIYGVFLGALIGTPLGMIGGLIVGLVVALYFNPVQKPQQFRWTMRLLGGVIVLLGAYVGFSTLFWSGSPTGGQSPMIVIPTLIAAACALYVGHSYAEWYLNQPQQTYSTRLSASATNAPD